MHPAIAAVEKWRRQMHSDHGDRGARAKLKRCESVFDALLEPETHRLIASVHENCAAYMPEQKLAVLAIVLARVKNTAGISFAGALGRTRDDARPRLSPMRFSSLLRASDDTDEFARALRRALAILGDEPFNVPRFIGDVLFFNDQTRRQWTFDYYRPSRADASAAPQP